MKKVFKSFFVPFNAGSCLYRVLSGPFDGNYMWKEKHPEESGHVSLFSISWDGSSTEAK